MKDSREARPKSGCDVIPVGERDHSGLCVDELRTCMSHVTRGTYHCRRRTDASPGRWGHRRRSGLSDRHSTASSGGCGTRTCLEVYVSVITIMQCPCESSLPAWPGTWKSYRNECPDEIGHWFTKAGPSAQFVPFWKKPCQCYENASAAVRQCGHGERSRLTILVVLSMVWFVSLSMTLSRRRSPCVSCKSMVLR